MKRALLAPALSLAFLAGTAQAADSNYNWTGPYAGAEVGYGWGETDMKWTNTIGGPLVNNDGPVDIDGVTGGVFLGYNHQMESIVLGVEADLGYADLTGDDASRGGDLNEFQGQWNASLRARLGYAFDATLAYVTGGVAWWDVDGEDVDVANTQSYSLTGWTVGGGIEHAFGDQLVGRIEYRYTDFSSQTETYECGGPCYDLAFNPYMHSISIGLAYRF